jgi:hypothetical protein
VSSVLRGCFPRCPRAPALVLAPLLVSLPLGFSGFLLGLPSLRLLGSFLACGAFPLLGLTFCLLLFVAGYGARWLPSSCPWLCPPSLLLHGR